MSNKTEHYIYLFSWSTSRVPLDLPSIELSFREHFFLELGHYSAGQRMGYYSVRGLLGALLVSAVVVNHHGLAHASVTAPRLLTMALRRSLRVPRHDQYFSLTRYIYIYHTSMTNDPPPTPQPHPYVPPPTHQLIASTHVHTSRCTSIITHNRPPRPRAP